MFFIHKFISRFFIKLFLEFLSISLNLICITFSLLLFFLLFVLYISLNSHFLLQAIINLFLFDHLSIKFFNSLLKLIQFSS